MSKKVDRSRNNKNSKDLNLQTKKRENNHQSKNLLNRLRKVNFIQNENYTAPSWFYSNIDDQNNLVENRPIPKSINPNRRKSEIFDQHKDDTLKFTSSEFIFSQYEPNLVKEKTDKNKLPDWFFTDHSKINNSFNNNTRGEEALVSNKKCISKTSEISSKTHENQNVKDKETLQPIENYNESNLSLNTEKVIEEMETDIPVSNPMINPHLQNLQQYHNDMASLEIKIVAQNKIVDDLKKECDKQLQLLEEMTEQKKALVMMIKNVCQGICDDVSQRNKDNEVSENFPEDCASHKITNKSMSEDSNESDSDSSTDVEIISETFIHRNICSQSDKSSTVSSIINTESSKSIATDHTDHIQTKTANIPMSPPIHAEKPDSLNIKMTPKTLKDKNHLILSPDSHCKSQTSSVNNDNGYTQSHFDKQSASDKFEINKNEDESIEKLLNYNDFETELLRSVKPDADNGLFNAIEPTLAPLSVGDKNTAVIDIKIFNNRLFVGGSCGLLRQYHLKTHQCIMTYNCQQNHINSILPTAYPSGVKKLISGGEDKSLFIHDIDSGVILKRIDHDHPILCICDYLENVYYGTSHGHIMIYSLEKEMQMGDIQVSESPVLCVAATREIERNLLFVGSQNGEYNIWDAKTLIKIRNVTPVAHVDIPIGFGVLSKQRLLAYTSSHVHFIHYIKMKNTVSLNHFKSINTMCLTRNYAVVGTKTGDVYLYKMKGSHIFKTPIYSFNNSSSEILSLTFYNNTIITGDRTGTIHFNRLVET